MASASSPCVRKGHKRRRCPPAPPLCQSILFLFPLSSGKAGKQPQAPGVTLDYTGICLYQSSLNADRSQANALRRLDLQQVQSLHLLLLASFFVQNSHHVSFRSKQPKSNLSNLRYVCSSAVPDFTPRFAQLDKKVLRYYGVFEDLLDPAVVGSSPAGKFCTLRLRAAIGNRSRLVTD
jgi:hypothetical protein